MMRIKLLTTNSTFSVTDIGASHSQEKVMSRFPQRSMCDGKRNGMKSNILTTSRAGTTPPAGFCTFPYSLSSSQPSPLPPLTPRHRPYRCCYRSYKDVECNASRASTYCVLTSALQPSSPELCRHSPELWFSTSSDQCLLAA